MKKEEDPEKILQRGVAFTNQRWADLDIAAVLSGMTRPELINKLVDEYLEKDERFKAVRKQK